MEWGDRRIRRLLRKLRTPGAIDGDDLGRALVRATGLGSAREAVLSVAERALRDFPPIYWTIVRRVDLEGESCDVVASQIHLSPRSFFRYRAAAVAGIAREVERVTRWAPAQPAEDLNLSRWSNAAATSQA